MIVFVLFAFVFLTFSTNITEKVPHVDDLYHYYVENGYAETFAKNIVTAVYLEYRVFDTLFETLLLFISATAIVHNLNKDELLNEANNRNSKENTTTS
jgi:multisubunit Na+/H+ antiporter MnhB subunit